MLTQIVETNPVELARALARDAQLNETMPQPAHSEPVVPRKRAGGRMGSFREGWKHWIALNATDLVWTALVIGGVIFTTCVDERVTNVGRSPREPCALPTERERERYSFKPEILMQWRRSSSKRVGFFHGARSADSRIAILAAVALFGSREARADRGGLNSKVQRVRKGDSLPFAARPRSSTTGRNEIIDDCFWISYDYQELSSKIGRAGDLRAYQEINAQSGG